MAETARLMVDKTTTVLCQHLQKAHIEYLRSYPNLNFCIQADNGYETFKISFKPAYQGFLVTYSNSCTDYFLQYYQSQMELETEFRKYQNRGNGRG